MARTRELNIRGVLFAVRSLQLNISGVGSVVRIGGLCQTVIREKNRCILVLVDLNEKSCM